MNEGDFLGGDAVTEEQRSLSVLRLAAALACILAFSAPAVLAGPKDRGLDRGHPKLERALQQVVRDQPGGDSRIIVELTDDAPRGLVRQFGGVEGRRLRSFPGQVARLSNARLESLANSRWVKSIHLDRPTGGSLKRTAMVVGARAVQRWMGYSGAGIGVALLDSGITSWHDDLTGTGLGGQKVVQFVDFVNYLPNAYDDNGHGTHVAGVIAGSGYDSYGKRAGIAPGAHLIGLKVLDLNGAGYISDVIAAIDWMIANKATYNIRVANLSIGASITQSYMTDPLTLAARCAVEAGIVVVAAAGNVGRNAAGQVQYGGITAPGNAPWVLTVGASSHMGTTSRHDDTVAGYSSRGPTGRDFLSKPDVVAPGTGTVSLSDPTSRFYTSKAAFLVGGGRPTAYLPYLSLTGTSMAAPVVTGTVALMLEANPALTPNAVKALLQYTAQVYPGYDHLTQGAGFLNTYGAMQLAKFFRQATPGARFPKSRRWSQHIIWGNQRLTGGVIMPTANAWAQNIVWGAARDADGDNIVWGTACRLGANCDNIVWGTLGRDGDNIVWGTGERLDNIVWGTSGDGDNIVWGTGLSDDNIVWGVSIDSLDNIVWGTAGDADNIVWGTDCGGRDCDNIVWGTAGDADNIVWGTAERAENIVWGTSGTIDNIVWGVASDQDNVTWGSNASDVVVFGDPTVTEASILDAGVYDALFEPEPPPPDSSPPPDPGPSLECTTVTTSVTDPLTGLVTTTTTTTCTGGGI